MKSLVIDHKKNFIDLINEIIVSDSRGEKKDIFDGVEAVCNVIKQQALIGGKVMFIGNGGSAAISSHMAIDFWKNGGIPAIAFNDGPLLTCIGNDYGYEHIFEKPVAFYAKQGDVMIAISSSGRSENIINGVNAAIDKGCTVITLSGFEKNNPLRNMGLYNFYVPSGKYGPVEVVHQYICHWILDVIIESNLNKSEG
jgi:D-sedoheptulose 7-phosphate isomerase